LLLDIKYELSVYIFIIPTDGKGGCNATAPDTKYRLAKI
jgi:hypothetical protein